VELFWTILLSVAAVGGTGFLAAVAYRLHAAGLDR